MLLVLCFLCAVVASALRKTAEDDAALLSAAVAPRAVIIPECVAAARAAHRYGVHLRDVDANGIIDINDIGQHALAFGLHWADTDNDGTLSRAEVQALYERTVPFYARATAWALSFVTSKYTLQRVFDDCDADGDGVITLVDYEARRHLSCMETCGKAEDVFEFLGTKFGAI